MKAIETTYQGVRFRSRLEARWAVFFDAMGIKWEYEPQGFEFASRLDRHSYEKRETFHYLPDFKLPHLGLWVEVKGSLTAAECRRLLECAAALSAAETSGGCTGPKNDVVVLGPFDSHHGGKPWFPTRLHFHKGDLMAGPWSGGFNQCGYGEISVARDCGEYGLMYEEDESLSQTIELLLGGWQAGMRWIDNRPSRVVPSETLAEALDRARSARFEHGEQPDTTPIKIAAADKPCSSIWKPSVGPPRPMRPGPAAEARRVLAASTRSDGVTQFVAEIRVLLGPDAFPPMLGDEGARWFLANYRHQFPKHIAEIEAIRTACGL